MMLIFADGESFATIARDATGIINNFGGSLWHIPFDSCAGSYKLHSPHFFMAFPFLYAKEKGRTLRPSHYRAALLRFDFVNVEVIVTLRFLPLAAILDIKRFVNI